MNQQGFYIMCMKYTSVTYTHFKSVCSHCTWFYFVIFFFVLWRKVDLFCLIFTPSVKKTQNIIAALNINQSDQNDYQERSKPLSKTRKDKKEQYVSALVIEVLSQQ